MKVSQGSVQAEVSGVLNNDACTHMKCPNCSIKWCYFCEKSCGSWDESYNHENFGGHNNDWKTNSKRCPMKMEDISEIDKRYENDATEALETFHSILVHQNIKKLYEKYNDLDFEELYTRHPVVRSDEIDLEKVKTGDLTLIKRLS